MGKRGKTMDSFHLLDRWIRGKDATPFKREAAKYSEVWSIKASVLRSKRIIACTTTAAAKYVQSLNSVPPGIILAEEAGEILESHILTALGPYTKQLVLIGDHKQLRPKVNYALSVEKGDVNRSIIPYWYFKS
jgi:superfamily I DNA and/or RNA helicase